MNLFLSRKKKIIKEHEKLGYPKFSKEEQLQMLITSNFSPIARLTEYNDWTEELLNKYFDLTISEVAEYLISVNYFSDSIVDKEPSNDGIWIVKGNDSYLLVDRERGIDFHRKYYSELFEISKYLSNRIMKQIPKYR